MFTFEVVKIADSTGICAINPRPLLFVFRMRQHDRMEMESMLDLGGVRPGLERMCVY